MLVSMVLTIGHSTRPLEDFLSLLEIHGVSRVIDVRSAPRSKRNPQFNRETLAESLAARGIGYSHMSGLGGLRRPRKDSRNTAWRNDSFRGYADYMETPAFESAIEELIAAAEAERVSIMCAEAVPWRCHRSLISDALAARGHKVEHILGAGPRQAHAVTSFAKIEGGRVSYPGEQLNLPL